MKFNLKWAAWWAVNAFLLIFLASLFVMEIRPFPTYDELEVTSGTISSTRECVRIKGKRVTIIRQDNNMAKVMYVPCTAELKNLDAMLNHKITVRSVDRPGKLFRNKTEVWQVELGDRVLYSYVDRLQRERMTRPYGIASLFLFVIIFVCFQIISFKKIAKKSPG